jgi:hypothetical protein
MPASAFATVQSLRSVQRELSQGPVMPRLWHALRGEWQRMADRAAAHSVRKLDHAGVTADFQMACRRNFH